MNTLASVAFGAVTLTAAAVGLSEPAAARSNVGVYISPYGIGVTLNPNYCADYWYRQNHWDYCARVYGSYDSRYYAPYFNGFYSNGIRYRHNNWQRNRHFDNRRGGDHHFDGRRDGNRHH